MLLTRRGFQFLFALLVFCSISLSVTAAPLVLKSGVLEPQAINLAASKSDVVGLYVVQWQAAIGETERKLLTELKLNTLDYLPENAFLVQASAKVLVELRARDPRVSVFHYAPEWRLDPRLGKRSFIHEGENMRVVLELARAEAAPRIEKYLGVRLEPWTGRYFLTTAPLGLLRSLLADADVLWLEEWTPLELFSLTASDLGVEPHAAKRSSPTGFESGTKIMLADALWAQGITGSGQIVGYADTGLDVGELNRLHQDFAGGIKTATALGLGGRSWADPQAHGTHVAGSIAGRGTQSNGLIRGTAFGAELVVQGMWSDIANNIFPPSTDVLFARSFTDGARIHSNSWGRPQPDYDALAKSVDTYIYNNPGFLAVFAAGNSGADSNRDGVVDEGSLGTPATAKNVMTIGASKNFLREGGIQKPLRELRDGQTKWGVEPLASSFLSEDAQGMAAFSSRGPTTDGRIKPELVAPGTNIVAARSRHPKATTGWGEYGADYLYMGGTSMATPLAAGALALLRQVLAEKHGVSAPSGALLKAFAVNGAFDLFPGQFGERAQGQEQPSRRPNNHQGWGRIDLSQAIPASGAYQVFEEQEGLATGGEWTREVEVGAGEVLRVTMSYTDPAPASAAARALVNNLDLELVLPSGAKVFPNRRNNADPVNNLEHIDLRIAEGGKYRIVVRGTSVPSGRSGKQAFALVSFRGGSTP